MRFLTIAMILLIGLLSACEDKKDEKKEPQLRDAEIMAGAECQEDSDMGLEGGQEEPQGGAEQEDMDGGQDVSGGEEPEEEPVLPVAGAQMPEEEEPEPEEGGEMEEEGMDPEEDPEEG